MAKEKKAAKKPKPLPDLIPAKRTVQSKALLKLGWKLKPIRTRGVCAKQGCNIKWSGSPSRVFCKKHKKALRKVQLKLNNIVWMKRVKAGTAGHHVVYKEHVTKFAAKKPKEALKKVEQGKATVDVPTFKKILKAAPKVKSAPAKEEKKVKVKAKKEKKVEKPKVNKVAAVKPEKIKKAKAITPPPQVDVPDEGPDELVPDDE